MNQFNKKYLKPWGLKIVEKFPLVFTEFDKNVEYYCKFPESERVNLRYGFEHEEGWSPLIEELSTTATVLVTHLRENSNFSASEAYIHGFICKEKFGELRWQGHTVLPYPFDIMWRAYVGDIEARSRGICEITGKYGKKRLTKAGEYAWSRVLCDEEALKRGYDI